MDPRSPRHRQALSIHVSLSLLSALLLVAGCAGDGAPTHGNTRGGLIDQDGLQTGCMPARSMNLREEVAFQTRMCTSRADCPGGSFCTGSTPGSVCTFQCDKTTPCNPGSYCDCSGRCQFLPESGTDGSTPPDPACLKNPTLLSELKTTKPRACEWDDFCPNGAFCDQKTGKCDWECNEATLPCPSGKTCNCFGKCVGSATPEARPDERLLRLRVTPQALEVDQSATWVRTIDVLLETRNLDLLTLSGTTRTFIAPVAVSPGANLLVACVQPTSNASYSSSCSVTGGALGKWTFDKVGDLWVSRQTVWVRPNPTGPGASAAAETWDIRLGTALASNSPQIVTLATLTNGNATVWQVNPTFDSNSQVQFRGSVNLATSAAFSTMPSNNPSPGLTLPVDAVVKLACDGTASPCLLLFDQTATLSASGMVKIKLDNSIFRTGWLKGSVPEAFGTLLTDVTGISLRRHNRTGELTGTFKSSVTTGNTSNATNFLDLLGKFTLTPTSLKTCTDDASCAGRGVCAEQAFCIAPDGDAGLALTDSLTSRIGATREWGFSRQLLVRGAAALATDADADSIWYPNLYGPKGLFTVPTTTRFPPPADPQTVEFEVGNGTMDALNCRKGLASYFAWGNGPDSPHIGTMTAIKNGSNCSSVDCLCDALLTPQSQGAVLCLAAGPFQSTDVGYVRLTSSTGRSATCEDLYARMRAANPALPTSYTFANSGCTQLPGLTVQVAGGQTSPGGSELHNVFACKGWEQPLLYKGGAFDSKSANAAYSALCYDPLYAPDQSPFMSGRFSLPPDSSVDVVATFSGDATCSFGDEFNWGQPGGVDLLNHSDRYGRNSRLNAHQLLVQCLEELDREPPPQPSGSYPDIASAKADIQQIFQRGKCFSPAQFAVATSTVRSTMPLSASDPPDPTAQRLFLRLWQQWLEMHAFIASQGFEEHLLDKTANGAASLPEDANDVITAAGSMEELLRVMELGWLTFLDVPTHLLQKPDLWMPTAVLNKPDYRGSLVNPDATLDRATAHHEQPYGLAPVMLEAMTAHFRLVQEYLQTQYFKSFEAVSSGGIPRDLVDARRRAGMVLRLGQAIESISTRMMDLTVGTLAIPCLPGGFSCASIVNGVRDEGICSVTQPGKTGICVPNQWAVRWGRARDEYLSVRARLVATMTASTNPLGIDENDLPLFFGDPAGTNSKFFASSDYLMNTWALSAVTSAQGALEQARSAWQSARISKVQDEQTAAQRAQHVDDIKRSFGNTIAQACGFDPSVSTTEILDRDDIKDGSFRYDGCYIDLERADPRGAFICQATEQATQDGDAAHNAAIQTCKMRKRKDIEQEELDNVGFYSDIASYTVPTNIQGINEFPKSAQATFACRNYFREFPPDYNTSAEETHTIELWQYPECAPGMKDCDKIATMVAKNGWHRCTTGDASLKLARFSWTKAPPTYCIGPPRCVSPPRDAVRFTFDQPACGPTECGPNVNPAGGWLDPGWWEAGQTPHNVCLWPVVKTVTCKKSIYIKEAAEYLKRIGQPGEFKPGAATTPSQEEDLAKECEQEVGASEGKLLSSLGRPFECYRGTLGRAVIKMLQAQQDVETAELAWGSAQKVYEITGRTCAKLKQDMEDTTTREAAFNTMMAGWRAAKGEADTLGNLVTATAQSLVSQNPVPIVGAFLSLPFQNHAREIEEKMTKAREDYDSFLRTQAQGEKIYQCFADAEKQRAGFDLYKATIIRRTTDFAAAIQEYQDLLAETERAAREGLHAISVAENTNVEGYAHHYWYDEKAKRYLSEFEWAKRLVYLTMRAVEYEFQQSLPLRTAILTATHPDALESALRQLQREVATRAINRRRPEETSVVLSLRDDVLGIGDRTDAAPGERPYSAVQTFRARLWDPKYAIRDKNGNWLGQGIPFSMAPFGQLRNRCAERLWRVTATIQGDGLSERQPGAAIAILKRNTFQSQWCDSRGDGTPYQVGAVQPSRNLFRGDQADSPVGGEDQDFSIASIYPWFNVRRSDFYKLQYRDGASEELAGRGLHGEYVVLFPRELLEGDRLPGPTSGQTTTPLRPEKFPLDRVEDVLVRFDFLSVDNTPHVSAEAGSRPMPGLLDNQSN
jgi:hypothetical protein